MADVQIYETSAKLNSSRHGLMAFCMLIDPQIMTKKGNFYGKNTNVVGG
jgi:hypothetical protein